MVIIVASSPSLLLSPSLPSHSCTNFYVEAHHLDYKNCELPMVTSLKPKWYFLYQIEEGKILSSRNENWGGRSHCFSHLTIRTIFNLMLHDLPSVEIGSLKTLHLLFWFFYLLVSPSPGLVSAFFPQSANHLTFSIF